MVCMMEAFMKSVRRRGGATPLSRYSKGLDSIVNKIYNSNMMNYKSIKGFTLAEVLITLGIIGIVAALTLPTISRNIQQVVLKNQFKNFYSTFLQAILGIQTKNGNIINCFYWKSGENPYNGECTPTCNEDEKNEYGECITYYCAETGAPRPSDINGRMTACSEFYEELFLNTLKTTKICRENAFEDGCLPKDFRGADKINSEKNPEQEYNPVGIFADISIKENYPVYVLSNNVYIIALSYFSGSPVFTVDVNGYKGPNRWGYDIFSFIIVGNSKNGISDLEGVNYALESGGKTFQEMLWELGFK